MKKIRFFHPLVRMEVGGVEVKNVRVQDRADAGDGLKIHCLHPTNVSPPWWGIWEDALRKADADILREAEAPVVLRFREGEEWVPKYEGRAVRRYGRNTHSWKGEKMSAGIILSDFAPRLPEELLRVDDDDMEEAQGA